jgi:hypothetical protein
MIEGSNLPCTGKRLDRNRQVDAGRHKAKQALSKLYLVS